MSRILQLRMYVSKFNAAHQVSTAVIQLVEDRPVFPVERTGNPSQQIGHVPWTTHVHLIELDHQVNTLWASLHA